MIGNEETELQLVTLEGSSDKAFSSPAHASTNFSHDDLQGSTGNNAAREHQTHREHHHHQQQHQQHSFGQSSSTILSLSLSLSLSLGLIRHRSSCIRLSCDVVCRWRQSDERGDGRALETGSDGNEEARLEHESAQERHCWLSALVLDQPQRPQVHQRRGCLVHKAPSTSRSINRMHKCRQPQRLSLS